MSSLRAARALETDLAAQMTMEGQRQATPPPRSPANVGDAADTTEPPMPAAQDDATSAASTPAVPDAELADQADPENIALHCEGSGDWKLANGMRLSQPVEYLADQEDGAPALVHSSAGVACAGAQRREACLENLAGIPALFNRYLVTTQGDDVRVWVAQAALTLLGRIDTPAEALWVVKTMNALIIPCSAQLSAAAEGILIEVPQPSNALRCEASRDLPRMRVTVAPDASVSYSYPAEQACAAP